MPFRCCYELLYDTFGTVGAMRSSGISNRDSEGASILPIRGTITRSGVASCGAKDVLRLQLPFNSDEHYNIHAHSTKVK